MANRLAEALRSGKLGDAITEASDYPVGTPASGDFSMAAAGGAAPGLGGFLTSTVFGVPLWLVGLGAWFLLKRR
jgi:hypothetical protein